MKEWVKWGFLVLLISFLVPDLLVLSRFNEAHHLLLRSIYGADKTDNRLMEQTLLELTHSRYATRAYQDLASLMSILEDHEKAHDYASKVLDFTVKDQRSLATVGLIFWKLGDMSSAGRVWKEAGLLEQRLERLSFLGWQSLARQDQEIGLDYFKKAIELDPSWPHAYYAISSFYWENSQPELARPFLEKAAALFPKGSPQQLYASGRLSLLNENLPSAKAEFCAAWNIDRQTLDYLSSCLWVLWYLEDFDQGLTMMKEAALVFPDQVADSAKEWGNNLLSSGKYPEATPFLRLSCDLEGISSSSCTLLSEAENTE